MGVYDQIELERLLWVWMFTGDGMFGRYRRLVVVNGVDQVPDVDQPHGRGMCAGFFALISHVWGRDARGMARCGGRGGRGDYTD